MAAGIKKYSNTFMAIVLCAVVFQPLLSLCPVIAHAGRVVAIITSDTIPAYEEAVSGIEETLTSAPAETQAETIRMNLGSSSAFSIAKRIKQLAPAVIVTVGTKATMSALGMNLDIPLVFSMVLDPPTKLLNNDNVTGVLLDIPPEIQIEWIKKIIPGVTRIGIIYTGATEKWLNRLVAVMPRMGCQAVALKINRTSELTDMLEKLEEEAQVLLAVPDGEIYNSIISPRIILFCLHHKIPFIGLSGNFTRAGALFALDCDYRSTGKQTGELVNLILKGQSPSNLMFRYPDRFIPCINMHTARMLGIHIDRKILENARILAD